MQRIDHCLPWTTLSSERRVGVLRHGQGERKAYILLAKVAGREPIRQGRLLND
jgi:hypothetical protein